MFTVLPGAAGHAHIYFSQRGHGVHRASADSVPTKSFRNVTPITDCISHLKQSAPQVGDAFHFYMSEDEKQALIRSYRQKTGNGFLFILRHPDDLDHHPLRKLHYYPSAGKKTECPGLIYQPVPITLIFDCDNLKPRQLASLNELLENPPRLDGMPISTTVSRVVLADEWLIRRPDAPGPDFWRRIFALNGPFSAICHSLRHRAVVPAWSAIELTQPPEPGSLQIRCAGHDAFANLFGNLAINRDGKRYFRKGMISSQPEPATICLVDPPDTGSRFWQHVSDIVEQGYFIANGERVRLPASLVLQKYDTPTADIRAFQQAINNTPVRPGQTCGVINTHNFEAIFSDLSARGNTLQQTDTFAAMASEFGQLLISGKLTDLQWRVLKQRTESLPVPPGLVAGTLPKPSGDHVVTLLASHDANIATKPYCYHLAAGQQWEELWFTSKLTLSGKLSFRLRKSPLLHKLLAGEPVVLSGLEQAQVLAGHLESLLAPEPYIWIYGQKIALPDCRIHIVWPCDRLPAQSPWYQRWQQQDTGSSGSVSSADPMTARHLEAKEQLTRLLASIRTLPRSPDKSYPVIPVQAPAEFLTLLEAQLHIEQSLDRAETLAPFHWRKALNKLLAHPVRGHATIYSFVKAQISAQFPDPEPEVDIDGIAPILKTRPDPEHLQDQLDNFWPLARYLAPALADCLPATFDLPRAHRCTAKMAAIIHSILPEESMKADALPVADSLPVADALPVTDDNIHFYHGHRLRLLYDALLVFAEDSHKRGIPVHRQAMDLNRQLSAISHPSEPTVQQQLQHYFPQQRLTRSLPTLASDWLQASHDHKQQHARRLEQLVAMLDKHKIIELTGPSGTGKSCLAEATGQRIEQHSARHWLDAALWAKLGQPTVKTLTLGPNTTWEYLYGSLTLKKNWLGNLVSHSVPGQLTDWANSARPGLLVINEANLVPPGLLSPLRGLLQSPPRLCVNGQVIRLKENHRILLTGNPDNYPGRNLDPELKTGLLRLYYRPLPESTLKQAIVEPLLPDAWPPGLKSTASATIPSVLATYKKLLSTNYELTPRDLKDIMARFRLLTVDAPCPTSREQVLALAVEACQQSLDGRIDQGKRSQWQALRTYWRSNGRADDQVLDRHQCAFNQFFSQLTAVNQQQSEPLVINTPTTKDYIKTCWQFLQLREPGRVAMVVEGTAGWGKDALLMLTLATWQQQTGKGYQHLNGGPDQFTRFVQAFNRAWRLGEVLVVSELNIIPSGPLEEFLNDRLPLPHKAGFKLIGTVNPPTWPGRTAFPPSLASRFTGVHIRHDALKDYQLRLQAMGVSDPLSQWLSACANAINNNLRYQRTPLELTLPQILQAADRLTGIAMDQWPECLRQEWKFYLSNCNSSLEWPVIPGQSSRQQPPGGPVTQSSATAARPFRLGPPPGVPLNYQITRYFPRRWETGLYRLKLFTVSVTTDQKLVDSPLSVRPADQSYLLPALAERSYLKSGETPGRLILKPGNEWQPLPSLTPANGLTGLRTMPAEVPLELGLDHRTGQHFVRSRFTEPVIVDFIIKPHPAYFAPLTADRTIETQPEPCPPLIKVHLDQEVFTGQPTPFPGYRTLREIGETGNLAKRVVMLVEWFRGFSYDQTFAETGFELAKRLLQEQQGTCRHRAFLFQLLCLYWGIAARIVQSDSHDFVEVKCREGWRLCDLGGTSNSTLSYSAEPEWDSIYPSAPVQQPDNSPGVQGTGSSAPVKSACGPGTGTDVWQRIIDRVISLCRQWRCASSQLPQEASSLLKDTVLEEFRNHFRPLPRGIYCSYRYNFASPVIEKIKPSTIVFDLAPEQYLLAARHTIDHFFTLAPPEKAAIIDWSHYALGASKDRQSPTENLFCQWSEHAWQLYLKSPKDFPVLPIQSLQAVIRFNFDHDGTAQQISQRLFRVESIDRTHLKAASASLGAGNFSLLGGRKQLPKVTVTDVYWSHSSRGRPDFARLIRGEPCFPEKSTYLQEANTLIFSSQFLITQAVYALSEAINLQTGALFAAKLPWQWDRTLSFNYNNCAKNNRPLIRLINDQRSAAIYTPVVCQELTRFRVLIVGNFSGQLTIFESPAGENFNLIGSGIFSPGISLDCRESLETIKSLINEHDATILDHEFLNRYG